MRKAIKQVEWMNGQEHILLAIDVPRENEQSFKASEQIFSALWGVFSPGTWVDNNWDGKIQLGFSFEIVGIEGAVQYLVRVPVKFRDLVESAIYSQFNDVEITEVKDYMEAVPADAWKLESPYKVWGTQAIYNKHYAYPIRTYSYYEDMLSEQKIIDPLAPLLESMSKVGPGELLGMQILVRPVADRWSQSAVAIIKKMIGEKVEVKQNIGDRAISGALTVLTAASSVVTGPSQKKEEKKESGNKLGQLTPGTKEALEMIEKKISKSCFEVKIRHLYVAKKENFNKVHGVSAFWGAMRPFSGGNINSLRPGKLTTTEAEYFRVNQRLTKKRRAILTAFKKRDYFMGTGWLVMSSEELASLWHFPLISVKTPLLRTAGSRKGEAPSEILANAAGPSSFGGESVLNLDDKSFEQRFSKEREVVPLGVISQIMPEEELVVADQDQTKHLGEPPDNLPIE